MAPGSSARARTKHGRREAPNRSPFTRDECSEFHDGMPCRSCARIRAREFRRRHRKTLSALDAADPIRKQAREARAYVATYLRRGAIVPPDLCERCSRDDLPTAQAQQRPVVPWHPDPARPREIAWLCSDCRLYARSTREPIELSWLWPGVAPERHRGRVPPAQHEKQRALESAGRLGDRALPSLRDAAFIAAFVDQLEHDVRERLFADGVRAARKRRAWRPYGDPEVDRLLPQWVQSERTRRGDAMRQNPPRTVVPAPGRPAKSRLPKPPPTEGLRPARKPLDQIAWQRQADSAVQHAEEAGKLADDINARVAAALLRLRRPVQHED